ncbi:hypothetical protein BH18THE2_BH18THE2_11090 [soil metagenome]
MEKTNHISDKISETSFTLNALIYDGLEIESVFSKRDIDCCTFIVTHCLMLVAN